MWSEDKKGLIDAIEGLEDGNAISMGQCGSIFSLSGLRIGIDVIVSDLYYKGTDISRRRVPPPFSVPECPRLDYLLVTHDHLDHFDSQLAAELAAKGTRIVAPKHILDSLDIDSVSKAYIANNRMLSIGDVSIEAIPVCHMEYEDSEPGYSRYYGYAIRWKGMKLFHGGDTLSCDRLIADASGSDYLFLPINGRDEERLSKGIIGNMDIDEAIDAAIASSSRVLVPTHFDFFKENGADISLFAERAEGRIGYVIPRPGEVFRLS
ncbi:MAG: MBL fold metallo-hydrolase [Candidatus Ornithospirochaeta sp.]|nr:MBL fold metallo-hydrolase [Candidatus Ornithospirochaeta sp.]